MKIKLILFSLFCNFSLQAQNPHTVKELEQLKKKSLADIEEINRLLRENNRTVSNALNRLNLLAQQINTRKAIIQTLNQEITGIDNDILTKENRLKALEKNLDSKKQQYAVSLRKMYLHKNSRNNLLFILSAKNFTQSYHRMMYLKAFSGWQKKQAEEILEKQEAINSEKNLLQEQRNDKANLLKERQSEESQLNKEEGNKKEEVRLLEKNKKALQDDLAKKQKQANDLNRQIQKIISEEVKRSEEAAKKPTDGVARTAEVKGGYAMTASERALSATFSENKGRLPYPLKGSYRVVSRFGTNQHKELSRIVTNNNGIDIETTSGNEARVVFDGVVSLIFTLPGYNNSVIVRHGNYLTLYANLAQVHVKSGDKVATGQSLGKIYTDKEKGNSTLLHFELWKEQTKLDPMGWIK